MEAKHCRDFKVYASIMSAFFLIFSFFSVFFIPSVARGEENLGEENYIIVDGKRFGFRLVKNWIIKTEQEKDSVWGDKYTVTKIYDKAEDLADTKSRMFWLYRGDVASYLGISKVFQSKLDNFDIVNYFIHSEKLSYVKYKIVDLSYKKEGDLEWFEVKSDVLVGKKWFTDYSVFVFYDKGKFIQMNLYRDKILEKYDASLSAMKNSFRLVK